ncbi:MAG: NFACT RNA binding domain-containing protein [Ignavibacteriaceae bacterium]
MFKNYFILNRFVIEANAFLKDYRVTSAFTQEKEKLLFELRKGSENKFIEISTAPNFEYITVRDNFSRAKKNTIDFFAGYLPAKIISFEISDSDRIIKINLEDSSIYLFIRGKDTNVILIDKTGQVESFKKITDLFVERIVKEISQSNFISYQNIPKFKFEYKNDFFIEVKKRFPFLGKEIISEAKKRPANISDEPLNKIFDSVIHEVFNEKIIVYLDQPAYRQGMKNIQTNLPDSRTGLSIKSFVQGLNQFKEFDTVAGALNYFFQNKFYRDDYRDIQKSISKYLSKEIERTTERLNGALAVLNSKSKEEDYTRTANLLLINISRLKKGIGKIALEDVYSDNLPLNISLIKTLLPKQNVELYFDKAKNERIKFERAKDNVKLLTANFDKLKKIEEEFNNSETIEELKVLMKELKISSNESPDAHDDIKNKFRHFLIDGKYNAFVGRDSANNDLLTVKFAKQNDYWFHARSVSGSHVVLKVENTKEGMPKNILKKAASLAAFYSKSKTSGTAPVSFTLKKYVIKKKGMEPGKVALLKEEVLLVKPEISAGCELMDKE